MHPHTLIRQVRQLANLPSAVTRAIDLVRSPRSSAADIAAVIGTDPVLSARLLQVVNSPFYGFPSQIDSIARAIAILGSDELLNLLIATSAIGLFHHNGVSQARLDGFWEHSLYTGVLGRLLARQMRITDTERCFALGLLHDIGHLVLWETAPEQAEALAQRRVSEDLPIHQLERQRLGFDHGELGAALLATWKLPPRLIEAVRLHHTPQEALVHREEAALIHLADLLAQQRYPVGTEEASGREPPATAWIQAGLDPDLATQIGNQADTEFAAARSVLLRPAQAA